MKLLYFGTVCNSESYDKLLSGSKVKPSAAPFVFEKALTQGFADNCADVDVISFPVVPAFPNSKTLVIKGIKNKLDCGIPSSWIPTVNIVGLKQFFQRIFSKRMLKKWLKENKDSETAVLTYGVYQPVAKSIVTLCRKYNVPCFAIVADLPRDMYAVRKVSPLKKFLTGFYTRAVLKIQGRFDGYIYLTEAMKDVVNPVAPYTVVEGIAKEADFDLSKSPQKSDKKSIMYAGALNERLGIKNLLKAFSSIKDTDTELWLFGSGDCVPAINEAAKNDDRIKYFGFKSREEILDFETKAHLLINIRDPKEDYTQYSFPSKTIEYMLSGTLLLTTKLLGIPKEYFDYVFTVEDLTAEGISNKITEILNCPDDELLQFGKKAQKFILDNKVARVQSEKILNFIHKILKQQEEK